MESWVRGLNALLPDSIAVQWAQAVPDEFHARFSALSRSYLSLVRNARQRQPLMHARQRRVYHSLDLARMRQAATRLVGDPDIGSFRSSPCHAAKPVRSLTDLDFV